MGRSGRGQSRRTRIVLYAIPLIAVAISVGALLAYIPAANQVCPTSSSSPYAPPVSAAMDYSVQIRIRVSGILPNGTVVGQFIIPPAIGIPGCAWYSHQYDSYGVGGRYPLFVYPPQTNVSYPGWSIINLQSSAVHRYTLGDFFAVWGQRLDPNNMFGFTTPPPPGNSKFNSTWAWQMCYNYGGTYGGAPAPVFSDWGNFTLSQGPSADQSLAITFFYTSTELGCT